MNLKTHFVQICGSEAKSNPPIAEITLGIDILTKGAKHDTHSNCTAGRARLAAIKASVDVLRQELSLMAMSGRLGDSRLGGQVLGAG